MAIKKPDSKILFSKRLLFCTQFTQDHIKKKGLDITKRSIKTKKNEITYEHPIPSKVVFNLILKAKNENEIISILKNTDYIVILSHIEDKKLREIGLVSSMPINWQYGDDTFARYKKAKINILTKKIKMVGAIRR